MMLFHLPLISCAYSSLGGDWGAGPPLVGIALGVRRGGVEGREVIQTHIAIESGLVGMRCCGVETPASRAIMVLLGLFDMSRYNLW